MGPCVKRVAIALLAFVGLGQISFAAPKSYFATPAVLYRLSNKELSKRHDSFLIQQNYGKGHGAQSWPEDPHDSDYNIKGYEWRFIRAKNGGPNDYWIVNEATKRCLAQTDTNEWDVDTAARGAHGSVWTVSKAKDGEHYRIRNKASGFGLFQAHWGHKWDVHVWKDNPAHRQENPGHDAYFWKIQPVSSIPTVTIHSVKCIVPAKATDAATDVLFGAIAAAAAAAATAGSGGAAPAAAAAGAAVSKSAAVSAAAGAGAGALADALGKTFQGDDDLYVKVHHIKRWPGGKSQSAKSQVPIRLNLKIPYDPKIGFVIELMEYDSGSSDDSLGWTIWDREKLETLKAKGGRDEFLLQNPNEGSIYEITISLGKGLTAKR